MTNYAIGHKAEEKAAKFLGTEGFKIVAKNWKTRYCEIDVIAKKNRCIFFFEVKYRKNSFQGTGFEYITQAKQDQMRFAAELWVQENNWKKEYRLGAIELSGQDFEVTNFLSTLD